MEYNGEAFASSTLAGHEASNAFLSSGGAWVSAEEFPQQVWFQFKDGFVLTKIGLYVGKCSHRCPTKIEIIAGNDCGSADAFRRPSVLLGTQIPYVDPEERAPNSWIIPEENRAVYRCYGIKVLKAIKSRDRGSLGKVRMWTTRR